MRPGERVFLERYFDVNRHFKFNTYEVSEDNKEAVKNNGLVDVEYHKECISRPYIHYTYSGPYWSDWTIDTGGSTNDIWKYSKAVTCDSAGNDTLYLSTANLNVSSPVLDTVETGRVEKGSRSGQHFTNVDKDFDTWAYHTVRLHLFPVSQKDRTIDEIREYCSRCGRRHRKNENYCPKCGSQC